MELGDRNLGLPVANSVPDGYEFTPMHVFAVQRLTNYYLDVDAHPAGNGDVRSRVSDAIDAMEAEIAQAGSPASFLRGHPTWVGLLHLYSAYGHWRFGAYDEAADHLKSLHKLASLSDERHLESRFGELMADAYELTRFPNFPTMREFPPKAGREGVRWHLEPPSLSQEVSAKKGSEETGSTEVEEEDRMRVDLPEDGEAGESSPVAKVASPVSSVSGALKSSPEYAAHLVTSQGSQEQSDVVSPSTSLASPLTRAPRDRSARRPASVSPEKPPAQRQRLDVGTSGSSKLGWNQLNMTFQLVAPTIKDNEVYVLGGQVVGTWSPGDVLKLHKTAEDGDQESVTFSVSTSIPRNVIGTTMEFKFALIDVDGLDHWELQGKVNRAVVVEADKLVTCVWDSL